jgi:hypothetical protein
MQQMVGQVRNKKTAIDRVSPQVPAGTWKQGGQARPAPGEVAGLVQDFAIEGFVHDIASASAVRMPEKVIHFKNSWH